MFRDRLVPAVNFLKERYQNCESGETYMIFNWRGNRGVANCHVWTPNGFQCVPDFPAIVSNGVDHRNKVGWLGNSIDRLLQPLLPRSPSYRGRD